MKLQRKIILVALCFSLFSFTKDSKSADNFRRPLKSGVVIMFDDDYVDEWFDIDNVLKPYDWKATFFVTKFNQLSAAKIQKLKDLKRHGHEIGGHGLNHLNAVDFIRANGTQAYLAEEIYPMITAMNNQSLPITSFAYPFGFHNSVSDSILLKHFKILRGATYGTENPSGQFCYYENNSRVVYGLGIDDNYHQYSVPYFISLLQYARDNKKVVLFYAHKPVGVAQDKYETDYKTLIEICQFVRNNNMRFYTISDLYGR